MAYFKVIIDEDYTDRTNLLVKARDVFEAGIKAEEYFETEEGLDISSGIIEITMTNIMSVID